MVCARKSLNQVNWLNREKRDRTEFGKSCQDKQQACNRIHCELYWGEKILSKRVLRQDRKKLGKNPDKWREEVGADATA